MTADHNIWIPRILIWNLSSNRDAFRKVPLPDVIQNMIVLADGQSVLGYDASKGQLDAIDAPSKSIEGRLILGRSYLWITLRISAASWL